MAAVKPVSDREQLTIRILEELAEWVEAAEQDAAQRYRSKSHVCERAVYLLREIEEMGLTVEDAVEALGPYAEWKRRQDADRLDAWADRFRDGAELDEEGQPAD